MVPAALWLEEADMKIEELLQNCWNQTQLDANIPQ
jgi:hypothetical protein